ncbi:MAG TPA: dephospho-CoA kinase [Solirubrobacteraceae bacterium]|nr:dephospho-CoA kinase [Solirubrobacteraceae bacterium]
MPPFVALTGGIGAGKSTALAALERLGAAVTSSDAIVHELYGTDAVRDAVVARFGPEVAPDGVIDRGGLADRVFATDADRAWLEQLLWPLVRERVADWRHRASRSDQPARVFVVEVPLLFEAGSEEMYDATIAVIADEQVREARAQSRGHRAVAERDARQLSQQEKAARSTFVVVNDGDVRELEDNLSSILAMLGV